jgi:acyl-CoA synthetase (AMP-forming)/AMP-acid ligase II/NAD(P)-dependent dehydrogenase (short-subunit alcohol dehydrogenase family)
MAITNTFVSGSTAEPLEIPEMRLPEFVLRQARSAGTRPALIEAESGRQIGHARLADAVAGAAAWLADAGVRPGDVVALCAPKCIDFVIAWYAASAAGAVITAVNPVLAEGELTSHFRRTGTRWLVTTDGLFAAKLAAVAAGLPELAGTFVVGTDLPAATGVLAVRGFDVFGGGQPGAGVSPVPSGLSPDDLAFLAPSSGTTGRPKIVMLTHRNLVANLCILASAQLITGSDVCLALPPMFHIYGLQASLNSALLRGATVVIPPRFELGTFLRAIQDYRVTRADVVPPVAVQLAKSELAGQFDLSSLRLLTSAGAPLSLDVARACAQRLGVRVVQGYGLTEVGGGTHFGLEDGPDRPDLIGPALPGVQCRVVDPGTGQDQGPGEPGELLVRLPSMMRGYLDDPAATAATIDAGGWLHTGDVVTVDADGWYRVTDRIKELIKYKGYQVAPAEFTSSIPKSPAGKILRRRQLVEREYQTAALRRALAGKVVLVSGGGRGLGRLLAAELAQAGALVGLLARSAAQLAATVAEIELAGGTAAAVTADVTDRQSLAAAVADLTARLGQPDVLVNNAGVSGPIGRLWDTDPQEWSRTFDVNVRGAFELSRIVLPQMVSRESGRIINITSNAAVHRWPLASAYAASKAALVKLSETLAAETRRYGVAVFSFDPGLLPIGLTAPIMAGGTPDPDTAEGQVASWIRDRIAGGHGADPAQAARQLLRLAAGDVDRLSGRHLTVADDLDAVLANIDQVQRDDLHYLRLRTAAR